MDNKIINLDEYIKTKKFGDAESRKYLLELIKSGFDSVSDGLKILTDSFDVNEENVKCGLDDLDRSIEIVTKQGEITVHMLTAIDELDKVFSILDELIEEKRKSEKETEDK